MPRLLGVARRVSPDTWAIAGIALAVLLANLLYVLGIFDPNPLHFRSGLTTGLVPGPLRGRPTIDPSNGFTSQAIGHLAAFDLLHLHLPWWNPYEGTGMPLLGETQAAALFPPTLLTAFSGGQLPEHMLLEFLAGVCTYRLLRRIELGRAAALAGGVAFALNGKFAWFADAGVNPLAFLPMLLLGIEHVYAASRDGRRGGWRLLALAIALSVYAGFPEVAYIDGLMGLAWLAWRAGCLAAPARAPFAGRLALGLLAGLLLAAPMLVAMAGNLSHADLSVHNGTQLGSEHLPLSALPQLLMPYVYGQVNGAPRAEIWIRVGGYLSIVLILLAAVGLAGRGRRGLRMMLAAWALLVFARMYGQPPLLGHILGVLPEMSRIQFFRYATAALELPVIVLAALGIDGLIRAPAHRRRVVLAAGAAAALVLLGAAIGARPLVHQLRGRVQAGGSFFHLSLVYAGLSVLAVLIAAVLRRARLRAGLLVAVVAIDAVVLFAVPEFAAPRAASADLAPVRYLQRHLGNARFLTLGPIAPDYGSYFRLGSIAVDDFPPQTFTDYVHAHLDPVASFIGFRPPGPSAAQELLAHLPGYRAAGVRYVLAPAAEPLGPNRALRPVLRTPTTRIYRLAGARPYLEATRCRVTASGREAATLDCPRAATLLRRETWFPGWHAELDGRPVSIRRVDGLFQGVAVPAGTHRVRFGFSPPGMGWAGLGLLLGLGLLAAPVGARLRRSG